MTPGWIPILGFCRLFKVNCVSTCCKNGKFDETVPESPQSGKLWRRGPLFQTNSKARYKKAKDQELLEGMDKYTVKNGHQKKFRRNPVVVTNLRQQY